MKKEENHRDVITLIALISGLVGTILGLVVAIYGSQSDDIAHYIILGIIGLISILGLTFLFLILYKIIKPKSIPPVSIDDLEKVT